MREKPSSNLELLLSNFTHSNFIEPNIAHRKSFKLETITPNPHSQIIECTASSVISWKTSDVYSRIAFSKKNSKNYFLLKEDNTFHAKYCNFVWWFRRFQSFEWRLQVFWKSRSRFQEVITPSISSFNKGVWNRNLWKGI